jgi:hypothetical protein
LNLIATSYAGRVRDFFRRHPKVVIAAVIGLIALASLLGALIWDLQNECVRWSTGHGRMSSTTVCVETRPRWGQNVGK